jgi:Uma2 family endonuclease
MTRWLACRDLPDWTGARGERNMSKMLVLPRDRDWTVDDLRALPDDGLQYELADGVLLVTPAPRREHQRAAGRVFIALHEACREDLEVFFAPVDFQPTNRRSLQPDLLVVRKADLGASPAIEEPLLLAVEILSPSTRAKDLILKRELYASSGVESYWVVDLEIPSVTAWRLRDGAYVDEAVATGEEALRVEAPYPVVIVPSSLISPRP